MNNGKQQSIKLSDQQGPIQVDKYEFEPIKGYPMLNWKGKRPFTSTQYYPAQLKEIHGLEVDGWTNKIYWGDNLQVMSHLLKTYRSKIKLIYIDPPFDSKADYKKKVQLKGKLASNDHTAFEDKQYTDIWSNDEYLQFIYERLILIRELLSEDGSVVIHVDQRKNYLLRSILDEVFGPSHFVNEIVWNYQSGGRAKNYFSQKHDTLYWYRKGESWTFNGDAVGEKRGDIKRNNMKKEIDSDGRVYYSIKSNGKIYKYYEDDLIIPTDVWDISHLQQQDPERQNYPTQKPEELLDRIIKALTNPGDIVLDCFMGSGTTQAVAMKLGRRFIGADINLGAIQVTIKRLLGIANTYQNQDRQSQFLLTGENQPVMYAGFEVYNVNHYELFRNPLEAKDLLIDALEVQPLEKGALFDGEKDGRMVKIMPINRIATRSDLNELITGFDNRTFERRQLEHPGQPVEKITLICMGHEPDLGAFLQEQSHPYKLDVEVVDILRDKQELQFRRDSEARIVINDGWLIIETFYPMNLLQKLSWQKEEVDEWRQLVESVMIDWNYDGAIFTPTTVDIPDNSDLVNGSYFVPKDAGTIRVKITDLLSESLEVEVQYG